MFFSVLKFWFSRLWGGWKGKKWPKMTKNSACLIPYLRSEEPYIIWLIFGAYVLNDDTSSKVFRFSKFWFLAFFFVCVYGVVGVGCKRAKNDLKLPISVCFALSGTVDHIIKILIIISKGIFSVFFKNNTTL